MAVYARLYDTTGNGTGDTLVLTNSTSSTYTGTLINDYSNADNTSLGVNRSWKDDISTITNVDIITKIQPKSCFSWFKDATKLTTVTNIKNLDLSNATTIAAMFQSCTTLTSLDLSSWDTSKLTQIGYLFWGCTTLTTVNLSNWNTSKVINMECMFAQCTSLGKLDLSSFVTNKVTNMQFLFQNCNQLTSLDLSNFETSNVINMQYMFEYCTSLVTIYVSDYFITDNVTSSNYMFAVCRSIKGENGTEYNSSYMDKTYARIDKSGQKGYFTYKKYYLKNFAGQYQRVKDNIDNAYSKLKEKGATMPEVQNSANLLSTIQSLIIEGGDDVKELTSPIRIWNLDDGIYKLPVNCNVYHHGSTSTDSFTVNSASFLFITHFSDYKYFYILAGSTSISRYIYNGYSTSSSGTCTVFDIGQSYLTSVPSHSSTSTTYGVGTTTSYGHNKVINDLTHDSYTNGESLSAYQGYLLNQNKVDKIDGFRGEYKANASLNTYITQGSYMINFAPSDSPVSGSQTGVLIVFEGFLDSATSTIYLTQFYNLTFGDGKTHCYSRYGSKNVSTNTATWESWVQLG